MEVYCERGYVVRVVRVQSGSVGTVGWCGYSRVVWVESGGVGRIGWKEMRWETLSSRKPADDLPETEKARDQGLPEKEKAG
uniref:Uncharacterized protein n=1 Tax=Setaria digitata TaxID=48799 RepID=A0A915PV61_9BILA